MRNAAKLSAILLAILILSVTSAGLISAANFTVSGTVSDQSNTPIAGATVAALDPSTNATIASAITGSNGSYSLTLAGGNYNFQVTPPAGSGFQPFTTSANVSANTPLDIQLVQAAPVTLSGQIQDGQGNGVPGIAAKLLVASSGSTYQQTTSDASGHYSFSAAPNSYTLTLDRDITPADNIALPSDFHLADAAITLMTNTTLDIPLPAKKVSITVQDPANLPVAGATITVPFVATNVTVGSLHFDGSTGQRSPVTTSQSGDAVLWLFPADNVNPYTITVTPPGGQFAAASVSNIAFNAAISKTIVLEFAHTAPVTSATTQPQANGQGTYNGPVTVTLTATPTTGFTIASTTYSIDGAPNQTYSVPFTVSGTGTHTVKYFSTDSAGVYETPKTLTIQIAANQPPTANAGGPYSVVAGNSVTLNGSGSDPDGDTLTYAWDLDGNGTFETPGQTVTFNAPAGAGGTSPTVVLQVCDSQAACATSSATVTISSPLTITTPSPLPDGTIGVTFSVTLTATGGTQPYTWSISTGSLPPGLSLDPNTGIISGTPTTAGSFGFTVQAADSSNLTGSKQFSFSGPAPSGTAGSGYNVPVTITPPSSGGTIPTCSNYMVTSGSLPPGLSLDPSTGLISGTPTNSGSYAFTIGCTYSTNQTATKDFTITINSPMPALTTISPTSGPASGGTAVAVTGTGFTGATAVKFGSTAATSFSVTSATSITATSPPGTGTVDVMVTTPGGTSAISSADQFTYLAPLSVTTASLPSGTAGQPYPSTQLTASGGTGALTWSLVNNTSLPAGLSLSPSGQITGTPSSAGTTDVMVQAADSGNPPQTATADFSLTIAPPPLTISTTTLGAAQVGVAYSAGLAGTGGTAPYFWSVSVGSLPAGLLLDSSTGAISGTPASAGPASFTIELDDSGTPAQTATQQLSIEVAPATLAVLTSSLPDGVVGQPYSETLQATGGTTPYAWSVASNNLPAGLSLDPSSGLLSGTPTTAGTVTVTFQVADAGSPTQSANASIPLVIDTAGKLALHLPPPSQRTGRVGSPFSAAPTVTGGVPPYVWSISTGNLPAGLTIDPASGAITGTPAAAGASTLTLKVSDASQKVQSATARLTLTINPPLLVMQTASLPNATVGTSYSTTLQATGGVTPYTWTFAGIVHPTPAPLHPINPRQAGLSLDPATGILSGTPTKPGIATFFIQVKDAGKPVQTAKTQFSIIVAPAPLAIAPLPPLQATAGHMFAASLTASGGFVPYSWAVTAGTLPQGLQLAASTGKITGKPSSAGTFTFTAQVTDSDQPAKTATAQVTIAVALAIAPASLHGGTVNANYSATVTASGGTAPYTYSVSSGALPPGLTLAPATGKLTGQPTTAGSYPFTVTATDSANNTQPQSYTIVISGS